MQLLLRAGLGVPMAVELPELLLFQAFEFSICDMEKRNLFERTLV